MTSWHFSTMQQFVFKIQRQNILTVFLCLLKCLEDIIKCLAIVALFSVLKTKTSNIFALWSYCWMMPLTDKSALCTQFWMKNFKKNTDSGKVIKVNIMHCMILSANTAPVYKLPETFDIVKGGLCSWGYKVSSCQLNYGQSQSESTIVVQAFWWTRYFSLCLISFFFFSFLLALCTQQKEF